MDTLPGILRTLEVARAEGIPYDAVPGYETRGKGEFTAIDVALAHHDAFPARSGPWGGLRTCTFGRPDLRNSLCMYYLSSEQRVPGWAAFAVVAARVSWQAGKGRITSNPRSRGIEARNDGVGEPWPEWQRRTYRFLDAMAVIVWGAVTYDHKQHSTTGKIDRAGEDPAAWRREVDAEVRRLLAKYPALHTGGPITSEEDDDMPMSEADWERLDRMISDKLGAHGMAVTAAVDRADDAEHADIGGWARRTFAYVRAAIEIVWPQHLKAIAARAGEIERAERAKARG